MDVDNEGNLEFAVAGFGKRLGAEQDIIVKLEFSTGTINFVKERRGKSKQFEFSACVRMEKSVKEATELVVTFGHGTIYKKKLCFQSNAQRELFYDLVHAAIVTGNQAYTVFRKLDEDRDGLLTTEELSRALHKFRHLPTTASVRAAVQKVLAQPQTAGSAGTKVSKAIRNAGNPKHAAASAAAGHQLGFVSFLLLFASSADEACRSSIVYRSGAGPLVPGKGSASSERKLASLAELSDDDMDSYFEHGEPQETELERSRTLSENSRVIGIRLLDGEDEVVRQPHTSRLDTGSVHSRGMLFLTNYRITYVDYQAATTDTAFSVEIPLGLVSHIDIKSTANIVLLFLKDLRTVKFAFDANESWVKGFAEHVRRMAFPDGGEKDLFAFQHTMPVDGKENDGWNLYEPVQEYQRNGLFYNENFRLVTANLEYKLSPTYPTLFMVPASITDQELAIIAEYRSRARIPVTTWIHPETGATLSRCSQPLTGIKGRRCEADEKLFSAIRACNPTHQETLHIMDARPYKAAMGNTIMGKGFENEANYDGCKLVFLGIDNIHAIRGAHERISELCNDESLSYDHNTWLSKLETTQWPYYVRILLQSAVQMCDYLAIQGASVVTHCSDGWDRTSQLVSLVELMLDPHFRTLKGMAQLIEKEWLSFGHKFAERCGHADAHWQHDQRAPIFLHWVDVVYQLIRQFPTAFEFNEDFLLDVLHHMYSCRFGTFLFNSFKLRQEAKQHTPSLWTFMFARRNVLKYLNPLYRRQECRLIPTSDARRIVLWEGFFLKRLLAPASRPTFTPAQALPDAEAVKRLAIRFHLLKEAARAAGLELGDLEDESLFGAEPQHGLASTTPEAPTETSSEPAVLITRPMSRMASSEPVRSRGGAMAVPRLLTSDGEDTAVSASYAPVLGDLSPADVRNYYRRKLRPRKRHTSLWGQPVLTMTNPPGLGRPLTGDKPSRPLPIPDGPSGAKQSLAGAFFSAISAAWGPGEAPADMADTGDTQVHRSLEAAEDHPAEHYQAVAKASADAQEQPAGVTSDGDQSAVATVRPAAPKRAPPAAPRSVGPSPQDKVAADTHTVREREPATATAAS